jgi:hypothetical protein
VLERLWELFGENRLLSGSNWPVSQRTALLATCSGALAEIAEQTSPDAPCAVSFEVDQKGMPAVQAQMLFDPRAVERMAGDLERHS